MQQNGIRSRALMASPTGKAAELDGASFIPDVIGA